jgi:hypothetical protein
MIRTVGEDGQVEIKNIFPVLKFAIKMETQMMKNPPGAPEIEAVLASDAWRAAISALDALGARIVEIETAAKMTFADAALAMADDPSAASMIMARVSGLSKLREIRELVETSSGSLLAYAAMQGSPSATPEAADLAGAISEPAPAVSESAPEPAAVAAPDAAASTAPAPELDSVDAPLPTLGASSVSDHAVMISSGIFVVCRLCEGGTALVLKGSRMRSEVAPSASVSILAARKAMIEDGTVAAREDGILTFVRDRMFGSLSAAGSTVNGVVKGLRYWKIGDAGMISSALVAAGFDPRDVFASTVDATSDAPVPAAPVAKRPVVAGKAPADPDLQAARRLAIEASRRNRDTALKVIAPKGATAGPNLWENADTRVVHSTCRTEAPYQFEMCQDRLLWAVEGGSKSARLLLVCAGNGYVTMDPSDAYLMISDRLESRERKNGDRHDVGKIYVSSTPDGTWWVSPTLRPGKDALPVIFQPACA